MVAASSCALLAAGCGGTATHGRTTPEPKIPADVAEQLADDADRVAAMQGCAARSPAEKLVTDAISTSPHIPQRYREQLLSAANDLVSRIPECLPPKQDHGKHKGEKKHGKHGKGGGED